MSATPSISVLDSVVASLREAFEDDLVSVVLFGSAAEGTASAAFRYLNVLVVLGRFDRDRVDRVREVVRSAQASVKLNAMFLVEDELPRAAEAFAVKFADLLRRRRVVFGTDVLAGLTVPREAQIRRLRQVLLNLKLRLRWFYALGRSCRSRQPRWPPRWRGHCASQPPRCTRSRGRRSRVRVQHSRSLWSGKGAPAGPRRSAIYGRPAAAGSCRRAARPLSCTVLEMAEALEARALRLTP